MDQSNLRPVTMPATVAAVPQADGAGDVSMLDAITTVPVQAANSTMSSAGYINYGVDQEKEHQGQQLQEQPGVGRSSNPCSTKRRTHSSPVMERVAYISPIDQQGFRSRVQRTRLTFEALRTAYKRQDLSAPAGTRINNHPNMRAHSTMRDAGHCLYRESRIVGNVPGILIGDAFFYRTELCVVGLHAAPMAGISYVPASLVDEGIPITTSIVSSGWYLDDKDNGDILYYTGSGGRGQNSLDHHADQKLDGGNLALHNSFEYGIEVRVIRGLDCDCSPSSMIYVYDGLYRVVRSTIGPGKSGYDVCKFTLLRLSGQDERGTKSWDTAKDLKQKMDARVRPHGYILLDLSKASEVQRVPVCNTVDDDRSPLRYEYIASPVFPMPTLKQESGCDCRPAGCGLECMCHMRNSGGGPVYNVDDTLVMGRPVLYECGDLCGCPMTCINRVTQRGMKNRLEVFRSADHSALTGSRWGLRTLDLIKPGSFVCEYSGEVIVRDGGGDAPCKGHGIIDPMRFPPRWSQWGDAMAVDTNIVRPQFPKFAGPSYLLDVSKKMNLARYIKHEDWTPNVFIQFVLRCNEDKSFPHLMVFALDTIPPMRELTMDHGIDPLGSRTLCSASATGS